jgi:hypothetical protein
MGKGKYPFRHLDWSVDSIDNDPMFTSLSSAPEERHYFAEWLNPGARWTPGVLGNFYGEQKPKFPRLYVSDNAPISYVIDGVAQNVSFEFRMCLYKTADVPRSIRSDEVNFAPPIACYNWGSSNIYNHAEKKFEHPKGVASVCQRPYTPDEERRNHFLNGTADPKETVEPLLEKNIEE